MSGIEISRLGSIDIDEEEDLSFANALIQSSVADSDFS